MLAKEYNADVLTTGSILECVQEMSLYGNMKGIGVSTVQSHVKAKLYIVREYFVNYYRIRLLSSPPICSQLLGVVCKLNRDDHQRCLVTVVNFIRIRRTSCVVF